MRKKKSGFTLIELLTVMTIIAVLVGLALVSYQGARKTARDGKRKSDLEEIRSALEMYRSDVGIYPSNLGDLRSYITVPKDPLGNRNYAYNPTSASTYNLCAALETGSGSVSGCGSGCGQTCNYRVTNP